MYDDKIGGLLGMLGQWDTEKPFYVVGHRPLDYDYGEKKFDVSESIGHEHFIRNDGANFGFAGNGEFTEPLSALDGYELTSKYGMKIYDAALLEQAQKNWHAMHDEIDRVADEMDLWEEGMPNIHRNYSGIGNNCRDYARWLDKEYDRILKAGE